MMLVAICIASYQRPSGLKRLLDGLNRLTFNKCEVPKIEVIVVDNDWVGSAISICYNKSDDFRWNLKYYIEPQRGISYARNKACSCVSKNADFVVFIDDDEVPDPSWLDELLFVQQTYDGDVVTGPVLPYFTQRDVPNWVKKGKFFEPKRYPTGSLLKAAFTNNVLIRFSILQKIDKVFDERFALTGGEDSHFFMRLYRAGYKLVWADNALVYEWIPQNRTQIKWILHRGYLGWSRHSFCERELYPSRRILAIRITKALALIISGLCLILPSLLFGRHKLIQALLHIYKGAGTFAGIAGIRCQAYKITHGV